MQPAKNNPQPRSHLSCHTTTCQPSLLANAWQTRHPQISKPPKASDRNTYRLRSASQCNSNAHQQTPSQPTPQASRMTSDYWTPKAPTTKTHHVFAENLTAFCFMRYGMGRKLATQQTQSKVQWRTFTRMTAPIPCTGSKWPSSNQCSIPRAGLCGWHVTNGNCNNVWSMHVKRTQKLTERQTKTIEPTDRICCTSSTPPTHANGEQQLAPGLHITPAACKQSFVTSTKRHNKFQLCKSKPAVQCSPSTPQICCSLARRQPTRVTALQVLKQALHQQVAQSRWVAPSYFRKIQLGLCAPPSAHNASLHHTAGAFTKRLHT